METTKNTIEKIKENNIVKLADKTLEITTIKLNDTKKKCSDLERELVELTKKLEAERNALHIMEKKIASAKSFQEDVFAAIACEVPLVEQECFNVCLNLLSEHTEDFSVVEHYRIERKALAPYNEYLDHENKEMVAAELGVDVEDIIKDEKAILMAKPKKDLLELAKNWRVSVKKSWNKSRIVTKMIVEKDLGK